MDTAFKKCFFRLSYLLLVFGCLGCGGGDSEKTGQSISQPIVQVMPNTATVDTLVTVKLLHVEEGFKAEDLVGIYFDDIHAKVDDAYKGGPDIPVRVPQLGGPERQVVLSVATSRHGRLSNTVMFNYQPRPFHALNVEFTGDVRMRSYGQSFAPLGDLFDNGERHIAIAGRVDNPSAGRIDTVNMTTGERLWCIGNDANCVNTGDDCTNSLHPLANMGDINQDGADDLGAGFSGLAGQPGSICLFDGRSGAHLYTVKGETPNDRFGLTFTSVGDLDGDKVPDFIAGAEYYEVAGVNRKPGKFYVFSGKQGTLIDAITGENDDDFVGTSVSALDDIDEDGIADFAVGANGYNDGPMSNRGAVAVYSGKDRSLLSRTTGNIGDFLFATTIAAIGDRDHDGKRDLLVRALVEESEDTSKLDRVHVISSATGALLMTFYGSQEGDNFGHSIADAGDVDGDGSSDIVISAPSLASDNPLSKVSVFSGSDYSQLFSVEEYAGGRDLGGFVLGLGDLNGDGYAEIGMSDIYASELKGTMYIRSIPAEFLP